MTIHGVYLPHLGHERKVWQKAFDDVAAGLTAELDAPQAQRSAARRRHWNILAGDFNLQGLGGAPPRGQGGTLEADHRREALLSLLRQHGLEALQTTNSDGEVDPPTFSPYNNSNNHNGNDGGRDMTLDYICVLVGLRSRCQDTLVLDLLRPTDYRAITTWIYNRELTQGDKQRKHWFHRKFVMRRWLTWSEGARTRCKPSWARACATREPWSKLNAAAGAACAARSRTGHSKTPLGECISAMTTVRNACWGNAERATLTRCVCFTRRFRPRWRFGQNTKRLTERRTYKEKAQRPATGLVMRSCQTKEQRRHIFRAFWNQVDTGDVSESPEEFMIRKGYYEQQGGLTCRLPSSTRPRENGQGRGCGWGCGRVHQAVWQQRQRTCVCV